MPVSNTTGVITTRYTSDTNIGNFTGNVTFGQFVNVSALVFDGPASALAGPSGMQTYTPSASSLMSTAYRVYPDLTQSPPIPPIIVQFNSPVKTIRVFPNIDHLGSAYDGYQYTISGCPDATGMNCTLLFDATSVNGTGEPFTLGSFTGTAPNSVNNVVTPGSGPGGVVGYVADFSFTQAYQYFAFGPSTEAASNLEQELSAVASIP